MPITVAQAPMMPLLVVRLGRLLRKIRPLSPTAPALLKVTAEPLLSTWEMESIVSEAVPLLGLTMNREAPEFRVTAPTWAVPLVPERERKTKAPPSIVSGTLVARRVVRAWMPALSSQMSTARRRVMPEVFCRVPESCSKVTPPCRVVEPK